MKKRNDWNKVISNKDGQTADRATSFASYLPCTYRVENCIGEVIGSLDYQPHARGAGVSVGQWVVYMWEANGTEVIETFKSQIFSEARAWAKKAYSLEAANRRVAAEIESDDRDAREAAQKKYDEQQAAAAFTAFISEVDEILQEKVCVAVGDIKDVDFAALFDAQHPNAADAAEYAAEEILQQWWDNGAVPKDARDMVRPHVQANSPKRREGLWTVSCYPELGY